MATSESTADVSSLLEQYQLKEEYYEKQVTDQHLEDISRSSCQKWKSLPARLGIDQIIADDIDKQQIDEEEKRGKFFSKWKERKGSGATYKVLIKALLDIERKEDAEFVCKLISQSRQSRPLSSTTTDHDSSAPSTCSLTSPEIREDLSFILKCKREQIMNRYARYVSRLCTSVKNTGVSVEDFRTYLLKLPAFASGQQDKLLSGVKSEMKKADTINKMFDLIDDEYTTFLNCDIFQSIQDTYCDCEDLKYAEHLKAYIEEHKISEFFSVNPQLAKFLDTDKKLQFKFDIENSSKVSKVLDLKPRIAKILGVTPSALRLFSIEEGCVIVTFLTPTFVANTILPADKKMTAKQKDAFRDLSIIWVMCGDYRFEISPDKNGHPEVPQLCQTDTETLMLSQKGPSTLPTEWTGTDISPYSAAGGPRDVLLIVSEEGLSNPDAVQRRPAIELTEEQMKILEDQGIAREYQCDDLTLMKERYRLDEEKFLVGVGKSKLGGEPEIMTKKKVMKEIAKLMEENSQKIGGVFLHYIGHGRRNTGDWCFQDGFITFKDLADLYLQLLRGRVMTIVTDCSYSGCWVKECATFLDEQGVGPCGHKAKEKGILLSVYASCMFCQTPRKLAFSVRAIGKNRGEKVMRFNKVIGHGFGAEGLSLIADDQNIRLLGSTLLKCGQDSIDDECRCPPGSTWKDEERDMILLATDDGTWYLTRI